VKRQSLITKGIHLAGAGIAFNQEIGAVVTDVQNGKFITNPQQALLDLLYASTGVQANGQIQPAQTTTSILSKVGGYAFVKVAMFFKRHMRF
jgi:hypothetical protein